MATLYKSEYKLDNVYFLPFGYRKQDILIIHEMKKR